MVRPLTDDLLTAPEIIKAHLGSNDETSSEWVGSPSETAPVPTFITPEQPTYKGTTKLRRLYLSTESPIGVGFGPTARDITALFAVSPDLEVVILPGGDLFDDPELEAIYVSLKDHAHLKVLSYPATSTHMFVWAWDARGAGFSELERLTLMVDDNPAEGRIPVSRGIKQSINPAISSLTMQNIDIIPAPKLKEILLIDSGTLQRVGVAYDGSAAQRQLIPQEAAPLRRAKDLA